MPKYKKLAKIDTRTTLERIEDNAKSIEGRLRKLSREWNSSQVMLDNLCARRRGYLASMLAPAESSFLLKDIERTSSKRDRLAQELESLRSSLVSLEGRRKLLRFLAFIGKDSKGLRNIIMSSNVLTTAIIFKVHLSPFVENSYSFLDSSQNIHLNLIKC